MGGVCVTTFAAGSSVLSFVVWHDSLVLGLYKEIKQWNHEGVCLQTLATGSWVTTLVVWHNSLVSGDASGTIQQWNHEGECVKTFEGHEFDVNTLVVWHDSLYSGSDDGTIKQWVDEEWERERKRINIRNLLLVYSRSMPP